MSVEFITQENRGNNYEYAVITHDNGSLTVMPKETYDAQQAAQVAPQA